VGNLSVNTDLSEAIDRKSFIVGMITAFAECLASECKKAAFSPPFLPEDYETVRHEAMKIAREQGISLWYESPENRAYLYGMKKIWTFLQKEGSIGL